MLYRPTQTQSSKICTNFYLGGGELLDFLTFFEPNFQPLQLATASQIVSHMWRLIKKVKVLSSAYPYLDRFVLLSWQEASKQEVLHL